MRRAASPQHFSSGPMTAKSTPACLSSATRARDTLRLRASYAPEQPGQYTYSACGRSASVGTSSPSAHAMRLCHPKPHGLPFVSRLRKAALASDGNALSIDTW